MSAICRRYASDVLALVREGRPISQRLLARELGIAIGSSNLLVREMVRLRWIRMEKQPSRARRYTLTPSGRQAHAAFARARLIDGLKMYADARATIRRQFARLAADGVRRVVFYGTGPGADMAGPCLDECGLSLAGVVDTAPHGTLLGQRVVAIDWLGPHEVMGRPYDHVLVVRLDDPNGVCRRLEARGIPSSRFSWIADLPDEDGGIA